MYPSIHQQLKLAATDKTLSVMAICAGHSYTSAPVLKISSRQQLYGKRVHASRSSSWHSAVTMQLTQL